MKRCPKCQGQIISCNCDKEIRCINHEQNKGDFKMEKFLENDKLVAYNCSGGMFHIKHKKDGRWESITATDENLKNFLVVKA